MRGFQPVPDSLRQCTGISERPSVLLVSEAARGSPRRSRAFPGMPNCGVLPQLSLTSNVMEAGKSGAYSPFHSWPLWGTLTMPVIPLGLSLPSETKGIGVRSSKTSAHFLKMPLCTEATNRRSSFIRWLFAGRSRAGGGPGRR